MAPIETLRFNLQTANASGAGTDGDIYLGICGREFKVDSTEDDFEQESSRTYRFGGRPT